MPPSAQRKYRILATEDNPGGVYLLRKAFDICGVDWELTFVSTFAEAELSIDGGAFDLLISDFGTDNE